MSSHDSSVAKYGNVPYRLPFPRFKPKCTAWGGILLCLFDQIRRGWLDEELALYVAREWLHDAAERVYTPKA